VVEFNKLDSLNQLNLTKFGLNKAKSVKDGLRASPRIIGLHKWCFVLNVASEFEKIG